MAHFAALLVLGNGGFGRRSRSRCSFAWCPGSRRSARASRAAGRIPGVARGELRLPALRLSRRRRRPRAWRPSSCWCCRRCRSMGCRAPSRGWVSRGEPFRLSGPHRADGPEHARIRRPLRRAGAGYVAAVRLMAPLAARRRPLARLLALFALPLVPIACGYHFAHYLPVFLVNVQHALRAASDPVAQGWDLLGTRELPMVTSFVSDPDRVYAVWHSQVAIIVVAHVAGVSVAHAFALRLAGQATRGGEPAADAGPHDRLHHAGALVPLMPARSSPSLFSTPPPARRVGRSPRGAARAVRPSNRGPAAASRPKPPGGRPAPGGPAMSETIRNGGENLQTEPPEGGRRAGTGRCPPGPWVPGASRRRRRCGSASRSTGPASARSTGAGTSARRPRR